MLDKALALAALDIYVVPCREKDSVEVNARGEQVLRKMKSPDYVPGGFNDGTTDEHQIRSWWSKWPHALVGVSAGKSELACLDIDQKVEDENGNSKDGWFSLYEAGLADELDGDEYFTYPTHSGGQHFIYGVPEGAPRLGPTVHHPLPKDFKVPGEYPADGRLHDVDRRAGASGFIWWGDVVPSSREAFKDAPEWLLTLAASSEENPFDGSLEEWVLQCEPGDPSAYLKQLIVDLGQKQGSIDHEMMRDTQRLLIAHAIEGQPGVPAILAQFRALYVAYPGDDWGYQFDSSLRTGVEKFGAFPLTINDARQVKVADVLASITDITAQAAWSTPPRATTTEAYRTRVRYLMSHALKDGATLAEAAAFGLSSEARKCRSSDENEWLPDTWVWLAAQEAQERPVLAESPEQVTTTVPQLLTPSERQRVASVRWFGTEFMDHIQSINKVVTEPYYRLGRWILLSGFFGDVACLRQENRVTVPLGIYGAFIGPSATGKSEWLVPIRAIFKEAGLNISIGGDATSAALSDALIPRDGQVSLFHADEADGIIRKWKDSTGPFADMKQRITDLYGGTVPAIQRATKKDLSGIEATTILNVALIGVDEKVVDVIEPDDWISGFMNRFVFAIGERKHVTARDIAPRFVSASERQELTNHASWESVWATRFSALRQRVSAGVPQDMRQWISMTHEVEERHYQMIEQLQRIAARSNYPERLEPTFTRLHMTIAKCAALVACSDGRIVIEMDDYLVALEQGQEWLENLLEMVRLTLKNPTARMADKLYGEITRRGGFAALSELHRIEQYEGRRKMVDDLLAELTAQGRVEVTNTTGTALVRTREGVAV